MAYKKIPQYLFLILLAIFALLPFYIMLKGSFEPYRHIVSSKFTFWPLEPSFSNYKDVIFNYQFVRWFINSSVVTITAIGANLILDTLAAFALARIRFAGNTFVFMLLLATLIIPIQVIVIPLYFLLMKLNWIDSYYGLIVPVIMSPFGIFYLRQSFFQIPIELDEAALIDGAGYLGILFRIIVPNSLAALGTMAVLKFMWVWGDFLLPSLIVTRDRLLTLPVGIATFQRGGGTVPWNLVMPASVLTVLPVVILFLFLQRYFIQGLTDGAVKE